MNNYKHFGEVLEEIRISNHMTQQEASDGICTLRQYSRLEKGESNPRIDVLYGLSNRFNTNLYEYYRVHFLHTSFQAFQCIQDLNTAVLTKSSPKLEKVIHAMIETGEFKTGENFKNLCYAQALYAFYEHNYDESINYCLQGIPFFNTKSRTKIGKRRIHSNLEICILNCYACVNASCGNQDETLRTLLYLVDVMEYQAKQVPMSSTRTTEFIQNVYVLALFNLCVAYNIQKKYDTALETVTKAINYAMLENSMYMLPKLFDIKGYILIGLDKIDEARECLKQALFLYQLKLEAHKTNSKIPFCAPDYEYRIENIIKDMADLDKNE